MPQPKLRTAEGGPHPPGQAAKLRTIATLEIDTTLKDVSPERAEKILKECYAFQTAIQKLSPAIGVNIQILGRDPKLRR